MKIQVQRAIFRWEFLQKKERKLLRFLSAAILDFNGKAVVCDGKAVVFGDLLQLVVNVPAVVGKVGVIQKARFIQDSLCKEAIRYVPSFCHRHMMRVGEGLIALGAVQTD